MGETESRCIDTKLWLTELSALSNLIMMIVGTVSVGPGVSEPGLAGGAAAAVGTTVVIGAGSLAVLG